MVKGDGICAPCIQAGNLIVNRLTSAFTIKGKRSFISTIGLADKSAITKFSLICEIDRRGNRLQLDIRNAVLILNTVFHQTEVPSPVHRILCGCKGNGSVIPGPVQIIIICCGISDFKIATGYNSVIPSRQKIFSIIWYSTIGRINSSTGQLSRCHNIGTIHRILITIYIVTKRRRVRCVIGKFIGLSGDQPLQGNIELLKSTGACEDQMHIIHNAVKVIIRVVINLHILDNVVGRCLFPMGVQGMILGGMRNSVCIDSFSTVLLRIPSGKEVIHPFGLRPLNRIVHGIFGKLTVSLAILELLACRSTRTTRSAEVIVEINCMGILNPNRIQIQRLRLLNDDLLFIKVLNLASTAQCPACESIVILCKGVFPQRCKRTKLGGLICHRTFAAVSMITNDVRLCIPLSIECNGVIIDGSQILDHFFIRIRLTAAVRLSVPSIKFITGSDVSVCRQILFHIIGVGAVCGRARNVYISFNVGIILNRISIRLPMGVQRQGHKIALGHSIRLVIAHLERCLARGNKRLFVFYGLLRGEPAKECVADQRRISGRRKYHRAGGLGCHATLRSDPGHRHFAV